MAGESGSTEGSDDTREQGVEFGDLAAELEDHEYPATRDELVAEYGDYELHMGGGTETFGAVLGREGDATGSDDEQEFESAEEVRQAVFNLVGSEAVGRENYSDRGGSLQDEVSEDREGQ